MVSLRRRKLLGLCSGRNSFLSPLPKLADNETAPGNSIRNDKSVSVHPMPSIDTDPLSMGAAANAHESSYSSVSSASKEQHNQQFPGKETKRRKQQQRKHFENQEPCLLRGVYFKNMKWQAAIKVDKKQIHLGTVGSQEEAAHLYDRAAFMCGREPNYELSEEEKQELRQFRWAEFLAMTRQAITSKKHRRRIGAGLQQQSEPLVPNGEGESDQGADILASED